MIQDHNTFSGVVTQSVSMDCVDQAGQAMSLDADLGYSPADPYAVTATFRTSGGDVVWTFARDLIIGGLTAPTGDGDVHVWPCLDTSGRAVVIIELNSPDGELLVQVPTQDLYRFVNRTLTSVPVGGESDFMDIDLLVSQLMAA
jgi:Streptomyces sporulation and cell division protein, SsgA